MIDAIGVLLTASPCRAGLTSAWRIHAVDDSKTSERVRRACVPFDDVPPVADSIGKDARLVLIGEASHGTHEFYAIRAAITRELIERQGFNAVIVEADWPDAYRVNRFVRGAGDDATAEASLGGFERFPQWMWRNRDVVAFVEWLRDRNASLARGDRPCGFYGMDLYSLYTSIGEVLRYLDRADPAAGRIARERYGCLDRFESDPQAYGRAAGYGMDSGCRRQVIAQLVDLQRHAAGRRPPDGKCVEDESFHAEQNARLIASAEEYYREMFVGSKDTWNLRDTHMVDTIARLLEHLDNKCGRPTRAVVWAHNSHLGDARATEMGQARGEVNVGSLCRERWGEAVYNIGFTTHDGTVAAANGWGDPVDRMTVRESMAGSVERVMHDVGVPRFLLTMRGGDKALVDALAEPRLERAIGVIYRPRTERWSHYFEAQLSRQFDALIHVDRTTALDPLERTASFEMEEAETYPSGV
jgi:erythromycin esterase-like protein